MLREHGVEWGSCKLKDSVGKSCIKDSTSLLQTGMADLFPALLSCSIFFLFMAEGR